MRKRVCSARAAFSGGFNNLRIVGNQIPVVDPEFSLQIDPDGSLGEYLHIYSDFDGKTINRFVLTEWLYNAAYKGTDDFRFKLTHELGHWILHRTEKHTFLRSSRTNKILTKKHAGGEREADLFAREFLMPLAEVEKFNSAEALAKAAHVPLWVAKVRFREIGMLTLSERQIIRRSDAEAEQTIWAVSSETQAILTEVTGGEATVRPPSAEIIRFPNVNSSPRPSNRKTKAKSIALPLFNYAEMQQNSSDAFVSRSDQWFADFGWRGSPHFVTFGHSQHVGCVELACEPIAHCKFLLIDIA